MYDSELPHPSVDSAQVYGKLRKHILPVFAAICLFCYLDRTNLAFASFSLNQDLNFSPEIYGLGAGLFYMGYSVFMIPSQLVLLQVGASAFLGGSVMAWGLVATSFCVLTSAPQFFLLRCLLGACESGAFPAMWYHLSQFFPLEELTMPFAILEAAVAIANVLAAPIAALLLTLDGMAGLRGWQILFVAEGAPTIALGMLTALLLPNSVARASFLSGSERRWLSQKLDSSRRSQPGVLEALSSASSASIWEAARSTRVWWITAMGFLKNVASAGMLFWCPIIIRALLLGQIGLGREVTHGGHAPHGSEVALHHQHHHQHNLPHTNFTTSALSSSSTSAKLRGGGANVNDVLSSSSASSSAFSLAPAQRKRSLQSVHSLRSLKGSDSLQLKYSSTEPGTSLRDHGVGQTNWAGRGTGQGGRRGGRPDRRLGVWGGRGEGSLNFKLGLRSDLVASGLRAVEEGLNPGRLSQQGRLTGKSSAEEQISITKMKDTKGSTKKGKGKAGGVRDRTGGWRSSGGEDSGEGQMQDSESPSSFLSGTLSFRRLKNENNGAEGGREREAEQKKEETPLAPLSHHALVLSCIPFAAAALFTLWLGHHSQKHNERSLHLAIPYFLAGVLLASLPRLAATSTTLAFLALVVIVACVQGSNSVINSFIPHVCPSQQSMPIALALYNSVANLGGVLGPWLIGEVVHFTGTYTDSMKLLGVCMAIAAAMAWATQGWAPSEAPRSSAASGRGWQAGTSSQDDPIARLLEERLEF